MGGETSGCITREAAHAAGSADTGDEEVTTGFLAGPPAPMTEYGGWLRFSWCHPPDFKKGKQRVCAKLNVRKYKGNPYRKGLTPKFATTC